MTRAAAGVSIPLSCPPVPLLELQKQEVPRSVFEEASHSPLWVVHWQMLQPHASTSSALVCVLIGFTLHSTKCGVMESPSTSACLSAGNSQCRSLGGVRLSWAGRCTLRARRYGVSLEERRPARDELYLHRHYSMHTVRRIAAEVAPVCQVHSLI
uniref:Uncharacterized protein n=1 Tax=Knipowitschia caucasica TaxID=637954 RepID=A0AAV2LKM7_KNICA